MVSSAASSSSLVKSKTPSWKNTRCSPRATTASSAVARGLHGQHPLAGEAGRGQGAVEPGRERQRDQAMPASRQRALAASCATPGKAPLPRRAAAPASHTIHAAGRCSAKKKVEKQPGDRRADGFRDVDGRACPASASAAAAQAKASRRARRPAGAPRSETSSITGSAGSCPSASGPAKLGQPQRGQKEQRRRAEQDRASRCAASPAPPASRAPSALARPVRQSQAASATPSTSSLPCDEARISRSSTTCASSEAAPATAMARRIGGDAGLQLHTPGIVAPQNSQRPFLMCMPSSSKPAPRRPRPCHSAGRSCLSPSSPGTLPV